MAGKGNRVSCGIDLNFKADIETTIDSACGEGYDFIVLDIVNPETRKGFEDVEIGNKMGDESGPAFMLGSQEWNTLVVGKLSQWMTLDSDNNYANAAAEEALLAELHFATYLSLPAVLVNLKSYDCANLARLVYSHIVRSHHATNMWISVPMCTQVETMENGDRSNANNTWMWWNKFRMLCNQHNKISLALEVTEDLPDPASLNQWLGEPIRVVVLNVSLFLTNKKGFPVLSRAHQFLMMQLFRLNCQFLITGAEKQNTSFRSYHQYLEHLYQKRPAPDQYELFVKGYEDYLQSPLQPLMDNLESATYEVFEKDPVKYRCYQEAIYKCLVDKTQVALTKDPIVLMVLGAGRGPLVRAALAAAASAKCKIRCFAVEKNVNACVTLKLLKRTEWANEDVTIVSGDMRVWEAPELADIIVSELLGSFGDNELSPECLDGASRFLKPDCVSIPSAYTSYLAPVSSQKLYNEVEAAAALDHDKPKVTAFETPYVVRIHNYNELAPSKPVFSFTHPAEEPKDCTKENSHLRNSRQIELKFNVPCDTAVHGFSGYFHCTLYKDVNISIVPETHSPGMFSWFPIFFPVMNPVLVKAGDEIGITMWRKCTSNKVWYEWVISEPCNSTIHNPAGRSYTIGL